MSSSFAFAAVFGQEDSSSLENHEHVFKRSLKFLTEIITIDYGLYDVV